MADLQNPIASLASTSYAGASFQHTSFASFVPNVDGNNAKAALALQAEARPLAKGDETGRGRPEKSRNGADDGEP
jgi:hypothetical protein